MIGVENDVQIGCRTATARNAPEAITLEHPKSKPWPNLPLIFFGMANHNGFHRRFNDCLRFL